MVEISRASSAVTPCVGFSLEKECGSEKSQLFNALGSVCSTHHQETWGPRLLHRLTSDEVVEYCGQAIC
jgi:hypothetical protein